MTQPTGGSERTWWNRGITGSLGDSLRTTFDTTGASGSAAMDINEPRVMLPEWSAASNRDGGADCTYDAGRGGQHRPRLQAAGDLGWDTTESCIGSTRHASGRRNAVDRLMVEQALRVLAIEAADYGRW